MEVRIGFLLFFAFTGMLKEVIFFMKILLSGLGLNDCGCWIAGGDNCFLKGTRNNIPKIWSLKRGLKRIVRQFYVYHCKGCAKS